MIPKQAIEKAIEGGWEALPVFKTYKFKSSKLQAVEKIKFRQRIALDPLFWQALGKSLGWNGIGTTGMRNYHILKAKTPAWLVYAREFYDLILTGGDTEKWWEEVLNKTKS